MNGPIFKQIIVVNVHSTAGTEEISVTNAGQGRLPVLVNI